MKTIKKYLIISLLLLAGIQSFATNIDEPAIFITQTGTKTLQVSADQHSSSLEIEIADSDKKVLFAEFTPRIISFKRSYDLNELQEGDYSIKITTDSGSRRIAFSVTAAQITFDEAVLASR